MGGAVSLCVWIGRCVRLDLDHYERSDSYACGSTRNIGSSLRRFSIISFATVTNLSLSDAEIHSSLTRSSGTPICLRSFRSNVKRLRAL